MTVKELIEQLQQQDPDLPVKYLDAEWGPEDIISVRWDARAVWNTTTLQWEPQAFVELS